ncbi:MAG TPA: translation elongation factor-like protein [Candidatus Limnocylindria bacterium]|jgi:putative protease
MSEGHDPATAIGTVAHYFSHLKVAAVTLTDTLRVGDRIHIVGHTSDVEQTVESMEVEHAKVESAGPGDDVALAVTDHVRDHDQIYREA